MRRRDQQGTWFLAALLSLLLHAGALLGVRALPAAGPAPPLDREPEALRIVFAPASEEPAAFTELPPDRADVAPDRADFLSNVDSRARDRVASGETTALPASDGLAEIPQVRMDPARDGTGASAPAHPDAVAPTAADADAGQAAVLGRLPRRAPFGEAWPRWRPDLALPGDGHPFAAASDLYQEPLANPGGNADLDGDVSLSTTAWEYAPWLQAFRREVYANWYPPYAFHAGVIEGWTQLELEIARNGELLRCDVLGEEGHASLRVASVGAMRGAAPFTPLPDAFPEKTLILKIRMIYTLHRR
ncbi:MAG: hypothetical protein JW819_07275 [Candidatus Krumholzibacteriota bacterium]|nr:hypothetical protein [Candidatus Krumholzibacteriota bacterium]